VSVNEKPKSVTKMKLAVIFFVDRLQVPGMCGARRCMIDAIDDMAAV
jgi:hypothetical protein